MQLTPDKFYDSLTGKQTEEPVEQKPKLSLIAGNKDVDAALRFRNKYIRAEVDLIECKADRTYEWCMNQYIPMAQFGIIVYGRVDDVVCYHVSKDKFYEYSERDTGDWVYLSIREAYITGLRPYATDLMTQFSTSWPNHQASADGIELRHIRLLWPFIQKIEEVAIEDTPLIRRQIGSPVPSKYAGEYGIDPNR